MDVLTKEQRTFNMKMIKSKNTGPELILEKELIKLKRKFIKHSADIFGKPDFVFKRKKIAIFVDSDFWHGNPKRIKWPQTNSEFWKNKISNNILRDKIVNRTLKENGWKTIRIWEYDIRKNLNLVITKIKKALI